MYVVRQFNLAVNRLIQQFLDDLNSIEESIKFTFEVEENEKLAFLDTAITHHMDGSLTTSVCRKKAHIYPLNHTTQ